MMNYDLQNELVAWLPLDRGVHKPLRPIDVPEQQLPPQLFTDDLIYSFRVKLFQNEKIPHRWTATLTIEAAWGITCTDNDPVPTRS